MIRKSILNGKKTNSHGKTKQEILCVTNIKLKKLIQGIFITLKFFKNSLFVIMKVQFSFLLLLESES